MRLVDRVIAGFGPEDQEHYAVIQYCDARHIDVFHVPNSTWTKSVMQRTKNSLLGVRSGIADLWIPLPGIGMVIIEMKRAKIKGQPRGRVSPEQRVWLDKFNLVPGMEAFVAEGAAEAITIIESFTMLPALPSKGVALKTNNDTF